MFKRVQSVSFWNKPRIYIPDKAHSPAFPVSTRGNKMPDTYVTTPKVLGGREGWVGNYGHRAEIKF